MGKLAIYEKQMLASPDQQISLTDPDSRRRRQDARPAFWCVMIQSVKIGGKTYKPGQAGCLFLKVPPSR